MNKNKDYTFYITFFTLCDTLFHVDSKMLLTFKTRDKTNNTYLCLSSEMWTNSEYIAGAGGCGIKPK